MNDDALHSLRQDPPAAFASSLRARLQAADTSTQEERRALRTAWLKPLVAVASVAALFAIPAVRTSAASFLSLFRVRSFLAVPVDGVRMTELGRRLDIESLLGDQVTVLRAPGPALPMATLEEAAANAGFDVHRPTSLPEGTTLVKTEVSGASAVKVTADVNRLQEVMDALSIDDLEIPAGLHGQVVDIDISPIVFTSYVVPVTDADIRLVQARVPDVRLPASVDIAALGEIGLRILGLDRKGAHEMAQVIDWETTVLVPIPPDGRFRQVNVAGQPGLLVEKQVKTGLPRSVVLWSTGDRAYVLTGQVHGDQLVSIASSVQ